ncbi:ABC transporter ATP-binding protein [Labrys sp. KNU-23]|uniref:ABC transporter ATP-binding protein n=1 Tax=Labrys sp. KNU-23 TaxID=2789216 RepID=UPI0011ECE944|nr:ABC transporter ATP-binding protein [Labrys sp. KNU-23]QEN88608.1 ABC transporter ATP-binding protein [Labrys sp. KNU-23]
MSFLSIDKAGKRYGAMVALDGVSLEVASGSRTAIVGPSGSGKTTLLRLIAGFEGPDAGRIALNGTVLADGPAIVPAHRRGIGFVTQDGALFPHLTIADNIGFGLERGARDRDECIRALMRTVDLDARLLERRPHQLSGGQQQRVALARALARQPKLMLLDEPFSALDTGLREATRKAVAALLQEAGVTTILVTHDQTEALSFADQVAVLREGRLVQAGAPHDLYRRPCDRETALFLGEAILLKGEAGVGWVDCVLGRLAAGTHGRRGNVELMLRPEQVKFTPSPDEAAQGCFASVVDVEFGGALRAVTVELADGDRLRITGTGLDLPPTGTRVRLNVAGPAHVFEA